MVKGSGAGCPLRTLAILAAGPVVVLSGLACSEATRHRVLEFLFDGVPQPGAETTVGYAPSGRRMAPAGMDPSAVTEAPARQVFPHPPYRDGRCGRCHRPLDGQLFRRPEEGLCQGCHTEVPGEVRYVHGPVAVSACAFCHHHHGSSRPKLLLDDVTALCLSCHQRQDLTEGPHHETISETAKRRNVETIHDPQSAIPNPQSPIDARPCTDCHQPHGGADRFFLRPSPR
jgi:predicted CXXCH cytochrome family protein